MQIGIDLGGTKIEAAVLDPQGGFRFRKRLATPQGDYPATLQVIKTLVDSAEAMLNAPCTTVGVGHPGSVNPTNGQIRNANSTCLNGQMLQRDLAAILHRPLRLANDADCLALSEACDGVARGFKSVFAIILGTGVGGGWFIHGQRLQGSNGLAGEWGHNPLPIASPDELPGPACYCGRRGCIEAWLSGPGLVADYQRQSCHYPVTDAVSLVQLAGQGNREAQQSLDRHTQRLARSIAVIINAVDPEAIVLGGGLSQRPNLIADLHTALPAYLFLPAGTPLQTKLMLPLFGDSSGVRGAARLS